MSEPREIPCDHVIARLWELLDGEAEGADANRLREHLELCARCFPEFDFRQAYLRFMRGCSCEEATPELRQRVFEAILAEERRCAGGER